MGAQTHIAWTDSTFNPVIGCTKVGPGCDHCYAELLDRNRFSKTLARDAAGTQVIHWGPGAPRHRTSVSNWKQPLKWDREARESGRRHRVFCASLADVFDNEWPTAIRADLFRLIDETRHLTWQLLTKRVGNAMEMVPPTWRAGFPPHVMVGATVVTQEEADRDIPKLLEVPARRFLSIEPMLGPIDLHLRDKYDVESERAWKIGWVICGGESGAQARAFDVDWARGLRDQCQRSRVPFFMKQMGSHTIWGGCSGPDEHWPGKTEKLDTGMGDWRVLLKDRAGADPSEWPQDLRVRELSR